MTPLPHKPMSTRGVRLAGILYLVIIVCGVSGEMFLRGPLVDLGDPSATARALARSPLMFRLGVATDVAMALGDVGLAVLLYLVFEPVNRTLSLAAMVFRLVQAAILGVNLLNLLKALALTAPEMFGIPSREPMIAMFLGAHATGYDLGLFFFGINCVLVGTLIRQTPTLPNALAHAMTATAIVYIVGSTLRVLSPSLSEAFAPAYVVPLLAELGFCMWLLLKPATLTLNAGPA